MKAKSLVALDTDHIKEYVFVTNVLRNIRGASSILDRLNRDEMLKIAKSLDSTAETIYTNGGSGLFLLDTEKAIEFGLQIQQKYQQMTAGGASVIYVVQTLPEEAPNSIEEIMQYPMPSTLALLRHRLRAQKDNPSLYTARLSHPLMRLCDLCGIFYATEFVANEQEFYCQSCLNKQKEDKDVKDYITTQIRPLQLSTNFKSPLWNTLLTQLQCENYSLPEGTERPKDLNIFREFRRTKDYLGLIYADGNGMGKKLEECSTLQEIKDFALRIDKAVYQTMVEVIKEKLPVQEMEGGPIFPFDILLIGGDDLVLVTPAAQAMTVALTLAKHFHALANEEAEQKSNSKQVEKHSLSVGVVLAPTNYPFSLLLNLAEDALKFAKKDGSKTNLDKKSLYSKTRINFLVVSGNTSQSFEKVYKLLQKKSTEPSSTEPAFSATMRPYTVERLENLLEMLRKSNQFTLGRSKLQQLREAILHLNRSTSVTESLAVLRSWKEDARNFIATQVYHINRSDIPQIDEQNPAAGFPIFTFPWLMDDRDTKLYSTPLLDFIELYNFVAAENGGSYDEK